jgi:hypothetical protein
MQYNKDEEAVALSQELPDITPAEYTFVIGVTKGGLNQSAAYRIAYPNSQDWKNESVWTEASKLKRRPDVAKWIAAMRVDMAKEASYTREQMIADLEDVKQRALAEGKYIAVINAIQTMGKVEGHLGDKESKDKEVSKDTALLQQIEKAFGKEAAQAAAKKLSIETVH